MEDDIVIKLLEDKKPNQILFKVTSSENIFKVIVINKKVTNISRRITFKEWLEINCARIPCYVEVHKEKYKEIEEAILGWLNFY